MSTEKQLILTVICDSCSKRHHDPKNQSIFEARVSAAVQGWGWRSGNPNSKTPHLRHPIDWCPDCTEELALKAVQEVQS